MLPSLLQYKGHNDDAISTAVGNLKIIVTFYKLFKINKR